MSHGLIRAIVAVPCIIIWMTAVLVAQTDDRSKIYLDTHKAYDQLKFDTWNLLDQIDEARFHGDEKRRNAALQDAQTSVDTAKAAAKKLRDAIKKMEEK